MTKLKNKALFIFFVIVIQNNIYSQKKDQKYYSIDTVFQDSIYIITEKIEVEEQLISNVQIFYSEGRLKERFYKDIEFGKNGGNYCYYKNGRLKSFVNYIKDKPVGLFVEFYDNGILFKKGYYSMLDTVENKDYNPNISFNEVKYIEKGLKTFNWEYFNQNGIKIREEIWDNGKLLSSKIF